jgi:hypothetical protein
MNFSDALLLIKKGWKMARKGWNGKGMYVTLQAGYPDGISINKNTAAATGLPEGMNCNFSPYLLMKTADEKPTFVPWLPSQSDLFSDDWTAC